MKRAEIELDNNTQGNQSYIDLFASDDTKFDRLDPILNNDTISILFGEQHYTGSSYRDVFTKLVSTLVLSSDWGVFR